MSKLAINKEPSKLLVLAAFAALYIIWGSTYLGIRISIKTIPPFFLVACRFLVAGAILFAWCLFKGEKVPSLKVISTISVGGFLMLFMGNGAVSWAEQYLPSGIAAIIVATVPLWFVLLDKGQWKFHFSNKIIILGFLVGFSGVLLLFAGKGSTDFLGDKMKLISFFVLLVGTIAWATGSLYSKYKKVEASVTMKAAVQMLAAGVISVPAGLIGGEQNHFSLTQISGSSFAAMLYLIIMGSLIGYMSYIWLLSVRPASVVGTYAYVNPVVAVFLGWLILDEQITIQQILALIVILAGVILVSFAPEPKKAIIVSRAETAA
ncbi:EamA family transporter [Segetibacter sp.]|jgi:drug/metabolite transporter (DMT)-like permease|uniref:EamA family transporter n=1 Tax=Segetibacter sp. TaxID=2231182 RepID=UPI00262FC12A|nr:EamA family transporter [Segetibacter sp.]MCW3081457.1 EamA family transporter [Segetibacter sp.]